MFKDPDFQSGQTVDKRGRKVWQHPSSSIVVRRDNSFILKRPTAVRTM